MAFESKADLVEAIASYAKRHDLAVTDGEIEQYFIPLGESRIGAELRSGENEVSTELEFTANRTLAPADWGSPSLLEFPATGGGWLTVHSAGLAELNKWRESGNQPRKYRVVGRRFDVRPFVAGTYRVTYYARPQLSSDAPVNEEVGLNVLAAWPQVYLYAALIELHIWVQDFGENYTNALNIFSSDVRRINKDAVHGRGDKPAGRRA